MSRPMTCPQGHQWQADAADPRPRCPVCGAVPLGVGEAATLALSPPTDPGVGQTSAPPTVVPGPEPGPVPEAPAVAGYDLLGELGRGGMGVVYKARHRKLNRLVALKMILGGAHAGARELERFQLEGQAVARLQHPNIVQIYEVGEHEGLPFFSLEFVEGGSLADRLRGEPLPFREAAQLVEKLARAVHVAHERGIVHRDLKPANILLTADGTPKVTDFGLAKKLDADGPTQTGVVMGTPSYMAPEQAQGRVKEIGPATDVYALGSILYELLAGRPPFQAASALDTVLQVISEEPPPLRRVQPRCPRDLATICQKCLEKDARRRYGSALELAEDLQRFLQGEPILARPPGPLGQAMRWAARQPAFATTLIALGLFYAIHLLCLTVLGVEGEGGVFHWQVTGLLLVWAVGAWLFQRLVRRPRWVEPATYAWASMDVLLFTLLLGLANGPRSPLVPGYLLLTGGAALRFRPALEWFVTGLSAAGYLALTVHAAFYHPDRAVPPYQAFIFLVSLVLMGLIFHLLLRRVRGPGAEGGASG